MAIEALDKRVSFGMFLKGIGQKLQGIMARSIAPEEKLKLILEEMGEDAHRKRVAARTIRAKMAALADPDTQQLEPLERLRARRQKIVAFGGVVLKERDALVAEGKAEEAEKKTAQLGQLAQEARSLGVSVSSMEATYGTLK